MPGLSSGLLIGLSGLQAHQNALNVIGHNISNVDSPYYTRQRLSLSPANSHEFGGFMFGSGVDVRGVQAIRDKFLNLQMTAAISRQTGAETRFQAMEAISPIFDESGGLGLGSLVQNFFQGFQDLATRPEDQSVRADVVNRASTMINGFRTRYTLLREQRTSADNSIGEIITQINSATERIAALNQRIANEPSPGADQDARDQRQEAVDELAGYMGIQTYEDNHGLLQVIAEGGTAPLVAGTTAFQVTGTKDPANSSYLKVEVQLGTPTDITGLVRSGTLGGKLDLRDAQLPALQERLDRLAAGIQTQVNLIHRTGYALDGVTTGQDFFQGGVANYAVNNLPLGQVAGLPTGISSLNAYAGMVNAWGVNAAIVADPKRIAAAANAASPGDNTRSKAIGALQFASAVVDTDADGVADSGPYSTYVSTLVGYVGSQTQGFESGNTTELNLLTALHAQRDRVSGVDLDEEAASLITMQRGYQASARFISVIDQLTDQLVNQFGR